MGAWFGAGDWLLAAAALLLLLWAMGTWTYDHFRKRGLPYAKPLPFVGCTGKSALGLQPFADELLCSYGKSRGHDLYGTFQFLKPIVLVRDPDLVRLVTVKEFDHFTDHQRFFSEKLNPLLGKNLFSLNGNEWRTMRATLSPAFTSSKMKNMFPLIDACGQQTVKFIDKQLVSATVYEADMKDFFTRFTNDVIATSAFGIQVDSLNDRSNEFYKMGRELTTFKGIRSVFFLFYFIVPKIMEALGLCFIPNHVLQFFHTIIHRTIRERKEKGIVRPDMLQLLMEARDGRLKVDKEDEHEAERTKAERKVLSDEDVTAQAVIFFFAGFDTVSTLMCYAAVVLAHHPHVQRRLQQQVDEVAAAGGFSYEAAQRLKYLDMVLNEVQRMYSGAMVDRLCVKDFTFPATDDRPAYTVRAGELLWVPQHGLHHDPDYWPDPHRFDPERFSDENKANIKPYTFMPFGLGPRVCIGSRFALMETKIVLFHIMKNFSFVKTAKTPKEIKFGKFDFNNGIEGGFWVGLERR